MYVDLEFFSLCSNAEKIGVLINRDIALALTSKNNQKSNPLRFLELNLTINSPIVLKELPLSEQYSKTNRSFDANKVREFLELHKESTPAQSFFGRGMQS